MESLFRRYFDPDCFAAPYEEPEEHLLDLVYWVREALEGLAVPSAFGRFLEKIKEIL